MRLRLAMVAFAAVLSLPRAASAFCGFYVAGAGAKVFNNATMVVLFRDGTRTVLSMQNDYQGPPEGFAMVVPVPVVLQEDNVKTLPREVFEKLEKLSAPRLVEYWEQDPCGDGIGLGAVGTIGHGTGFGSGHGRLGGSHTVEVLAEFAVGEYEIVILGAKESTGLDAWLREHGYKIPEGAEPVLRPYVEGGMFFFVARVDPTKVRFENGKATLSPLRFHYDSPTFTLPVRLGLLNSPGTQDLIVHTLAMHQRYEVANYPNAIIPTNLDVSEKARGAFGAFYAALFDKTVAEGKGAVVTEYAWDAGSCDPCPGPALDGTDVATLGGDVIPSARPLGLPHLALGTPSLSKPGLPAEVVSRILRANQGRFRLCQEKASSRPAKREVTAKLFIDKSGAVSAAAVEQPAPPDAGFGTCLQGALHSLAFPLPEKGPIEVTVPLTFRAAGGASPRGLVLTRLHVRYGKETLGQDLVLKGAPAIVGGRERWNDGKLETGASPAEENNFQARYAIRHAWEGPVTCAEPHRGIWGGPPARDGGAGKPEPVVARDLAFAPRGGVSLGDFIPSAAAAEPPRADAGPAPVPAAEEPAARKGCGACATEGSAGGRGGVPAAALAVAAAVRRRRRRS